MAVVQLRSDLVPPALRGPALGLHAGKLRLWPTVWANILRAEASPGTIGRQLAYVDRFYRSAAVENVGDIERSIAQADLPDLEAALTGYLTFLANAAAQEGRDNSPVWRAALRYVTDMMAAMSASASIDAARMSARLARIRALYGAIVPRKKKAGAPLRSLPAIVLEDLERIFHPESPRNPFRTKRTQVRNYLLFMLYVQLGLRRGEALILAVDGFKSEIDPLSGTEVCWVNVTSLADEDTRYAAPSLKTVQSERQLPISREVMDWAQLYAENYRGGAPHAAFFNSQKRKPLSAPTIEYIFGCVNLRLSPVAQAALGKRALVTVTPRNCRHTAAVAILKSYRDAGDSMDEAVGKLRVFFGWSLNSRMPLLYARAYWLTAAAEVENARFDAHVTAIRELEGTGHLRAFH